MNRIDQLRQRLLAARTRLDRISATGPGELGAPDPQTGERWHRGNVLGHVAEMIPFWTAQARLAASGQRNLGRGEAGGRHRRAGIEEGAVLPEAELRARITAGLADLDRLVSGMAPEDLDRAVVYTRTDGSSREMTLGDFLDAMLVGHLEQHLDQLEELT